MKTRLAGLDELRYALNGEAQDDQCPSENLLSQPTNGDAPSGFLDVCQAIS